MFKICFYVEHGFDWLIDRLVFVELNYRLLYILTWLPLKKFTEFTMRLCVNCWNWILVARESILLDFLQEMAGCWTAIAGRHFGLFSRDHDSHPCPLSQEHSNRRTSPHIKPHSIWINVGFLPKHT